MLIIKKVPPESSIAMEGAELLLKSSCYKHALLTTQEFVKCCNSIYVITDESYGSMFGVIACRRIYANEVDKFVLYHPQKYHTIYQIDALHYDKSTSDDIRRELIETCLNDKNDAMIILKAKCTNVVHDYKLLKSIGFEKRFVTREAIYYVRPPKKRDNRVMKVIKNLFT